jgi:hypothetical protein
VSFIGMTWKLDFSADDDRTPQAEQSHGRRRLVERLLYYWTEISTSRGFVRLDDIDPWMIGDDWKNCLLVEVRSPLDLSGLLAVGENLVAESERQMQGHVVADYPADSLMGLIVSHLPQVLSRWDSLVDEGTTRHAGQEILYRCTLLPLSETGVAVDHVLAAANYKFIAPPRRARA